jgi:hypothetical protein
VRARIARKRSDVFLTRDFLDLGGEDQVIRALRELTNEQQLLRLGYGVYARARVSSLSGRVMLDTPEGFMGAAKQALNKLKVEWEPTQAQRDYAEGRSTQIPVNPVLKVKGRFSRQLRYGNSELVVGR